MQKITKVVTLGGGTGQFHTLIALMDWKRRFNPELQITAIPATTDSGSSSGVLRMQYRVVAMGDIAQCVFGLHTEPEKVLPMFGFRFNDGVLEKHTTRNMIVLTFMQHFGNNQAAMDGMREAFSLPGRITPITFSDVHLHARLKNGTTLNGEDAISKADIVALGGIDELYLSNDLQGRAPVPNDAALEAIAEADMILLCPGTLTCSLIPPLLVPGVVSALRASKAKKIQLANLMNRQGHEPPNWTVFDHLRYIEEYLGEGFFDTLICNSQALSKEQRRAYEGEGKAPVAVLTDMRDQRPNLKLVAVPLLMNGNADVDPADPIGSTRATVRHDKKKLGSLFQYLAETSECH